MDLNFYSPSYGPLALTPGWRNGKLPLLKGASTFAIYETFGSIHLQEVNTGKCLIRYFTFFFSQPMTLLSKEKNEGLQSLLSLKGKLHFGFLGRKTQLINERQFTLLNAGLSETQALIPAGKECHLLNTYYTQESYADLLPFFPHLKKDIAKAAKKSRFFLPSPIPARPSLLDAIYKTLHEDFRSHLLRPFWNMKLKESLFTGLAQTYTEPTPPSTSSFEKEIAEKAKGIIEENIAVHYNNDELARKVHCSESALKKAFRKQYGLGMHEYLTSLRMQKARELLLQGHLVKTAALEVGMKPSHFTMEFQNYFGYKATSLYRFK